MTAAPNASRAPGRLQLILLAVLFFAPFVAAWLLYFYFPQHRPSGTTNYGTLVTPLHELPPWAWRTPAGDAVKASEVSLVRSATAGEPDIRRWTLLQRAAAGCDAKCAERLLLTRQTRTALAADRDRVQRLLLVDDDAALPALQRQLAAEHPDLLLRAPDAATGEETRFFGQHEPGALYLIDPLGNYVMVYADRGTPDDFKGLQKDLKKLLKLSAAG